MNAVFLRHNISVGPGSLPGFLERLGAACRLVNAVTDDLSGFDALAPDILVVLGGQPGVYQQAQYPFLKDELRLIEKRLAADRPLLGICLGAQLIASALGAKVYKGPQGPERGWQEIAVTAVGKSGPARYFDKALTRVTQWHGDTFDLPRGAVLLATGDLYPNQVFSFGKNVMAFQPHIEVTPEIAMDWGVDQAGDAAEGTFDPARWRAQTKKHAAALMTQTERFVEEWTAGLESNDLTDRVKKNGA